MPLPSWISGKAIKKGFSAKPTDLDRPTGYDKYIENNKINEGNDINPNPITPAPDLTGDHRNTFGDDADSGYYESEF